MYRYEILGFGVVEFKDMYQLIHIAAALGAIQDEYDLEAYIGDALRIMAVPQYV